MISDRLSGPWGQSSRFLQLLCLFSTKTCLTFCPYWDPDHTTRSSGKWRPQTLVVFSSSPSDLNVQSDSRITTVHPALHHGQQEEGNSITWIVIATFRKSPMWSAWFLNALIKGQGGMLTFTEAKHKTSWTLPHFTKSWFIQKKRKRKQKKENQEENDNGKQGSQWHCS